MSLFAGIDLSTEAVDVVLLDTDSDDAVHNQYRLDTGPGGYLERVRRVREILPARGRWRDSGVVLIAIEKPMSSSFKGAVPLATVLGAVLANLPRDLDVMPLEPSEWKKWSVGGGFPGHGNAKKDAVADWARLRWHNRPVRASQNAYDAYAVAYAARALCDHHGNPQQREESPS